VIVTVPADIPVTTPAFVTEAMEVFDDTHGFVAVAVALPINVVVAPTHNEDTPLIVGKGLTVKDAD